MRTQEAIDYFGSRFALAEALGVTVPAVHQWREYPPGGRQLQIELLTKKKLKAEPDCMEWKPQTSKKAAA